MKNNFGKTMAFFSALALGAMLMTSGCTTVTRQLANGTTVTNSVPDPLVLRVASQEAASVGTTIYLQQRPQDKPQFLTARTSLRALVAAGSGSVADLQAALAGLPIKQLQGSNGVVLVDSAVTLIDAAGRELAKLDSKQIWSNYVQPIAQGILDGLDQALGPQSGLSNCPGWTYLPPEVEQYAVVSTELRCIDLVYRGTAPTVTWTAQ
jgi:hypothetical protein